LGADPPGVATALTAARCRPSRRAALTWVSRSPPRTASWPSIVFDDETRSIRSADVVYTEQVNCGPLILLQGTRTRTVRAQLRSRADSSFEGAGACRRMRGVAATYVQDL